MCVSWTCQSCHEKLSSVTRCHFTNELRSDHQNNFSLARWRFISGHREMSKFLILILSFSFFLIDNRGNLYRSGESFIVCCWLWKTFKFPNRIVKNRRQRQWQMLMEDVRSHRSQRLLERLIKKAISRLLNSHVNWNHNNKNGSRWCVTLQVSGVNNYFLSRKDLANGNQPDDGRRCVCCADVLCVAFLCTSGDTSRESVWDFVSLPN